MTSPLVDKTSGVPKWGREKVVTNPLISYRTAIAIRSNGNCHTVEHQLPYGRTPIAVRLLRTALVTTLPKVVWKQTVWNVSKTTNEYLL